MDWYPLVCILSTISSSMVDLLLSVDTFVIKYRRMVQLRLTGAVNMGSNGITSMYAVRWMYMSSQHVAYCEKEFSARLLCAALNMHSRSHDITLHYGQTKLTIIHTSRGSHE